MAYGWGKAKRAGLVLVVTAAPVDLPCAEEASEERSPVSVVIFGSMEAGPTKTFASVGTKRALGGGLAESGFRLFLKAGGSQEQTRRQPPHGTTYKAESQALLGYEWRIGDSFFALYAGSDVESEQSVETFGPSMITTRYGARLQADLWAMPADGMMLQANAYVSSVNHRLWGRLAPGWQMPTGFYVGPEVEAYREQDYRKLRLGLHLTGLRFLNLEWRLSGGWQRTSDRPSNAYGSLSLHWLL
ncbi:cellulose biosynthesis protein BcsS [Bosea sp. RAF48]|uniref:cellulose biosynthesis protein BcsS n=1 Tax=Bosea sp. RAF48 TaxID=3237480 RepID=UPI003F8F853A